MPVYFDRFHSPLRSAACAGLMCRAAASISATASSAAETMFEVGALTTMTPFCVAALTSTLSSPTPARATTLRGWAAASASASTLVPATPPLGVVAARERLGVHLGRRAHQDGVDVDDGGEQLGAIGSVALADLEV